MMFKDNIMIDHQHKFIYICFNHNTSDGSIAQLVEWVICDSKVAGSNPTDGNFFCFGRAIFVFLGRFFTASLKDLC